ncbi:MAG: hypothetical protein EXR72_01885 [Myxococcales bacterium]|nr:hypothetical protein [Myxococcales bacterium]
MRLTQGTLSLLAAAWLLVGPGISPAGAADAPAQRGTYGGKAEHVTDEEGRPTSEKEFDPAGKLREQTTYKYDDEGRLVHKERRVYYAEGATETKTSWDYKGGREVDKETARFDPKGAQIGGSWTTTEYDPRGRRKVTKRRWNPEAKEWEVEVAAAQAAGPAKKRRTARPAAQVIDLPTGLAVQPVIATSVLTLDWNSRYTILASTSFGPGLRVGYQTRSFLVAADIEYSATASTKAEVSFGGITGGLDFAPFVGSLLRGKLRVYAIAGGNVGALFTIQPGKDGNALTGGFLVGAGATMPLNPDFLIGLEVGVRTQWVVFDPDPVATSSIYIAVTGTLMNPFKGSDDEEEEAEEAPAASAATEEKSED